MKLEEIEVPIPEFPHYIVSNYGEVVNTETGYSLKPRITNRGYYIVTLSDYGYKRTFYVHRLVARAFLPTYDDAYSVIHKNDDKADNCILNLMVGERKVRRA